MSLSRLLYVSRCAFKEQGAERDGAVRDIAARAARRNTACLLTGALLYVDDTFVQVLEGPAKAVERCFEAICCDFRHDDIKLIDLIPAKDRVFAQWHMAFLAANDDTTIQTRGDLEEISFLVGVNAREAVNQMRHLLKQSAG
jgi:hypothetical protein